MKRGDMTFENLTGDCLEVVGCKLDLASAYNLLRVSHSIRSKLLACGRFWKSICRLEGFNDYPALCEDNENEESPMSYNNEPLRDAHVDPGEPLWRRIFLRGIEMRRNVLRGKFRQWRLYLTDQDNLPVKEIRKDTTFRELRKAHRRSSFYTQRRRQRGDRFWTDDYFLSVQGRTSARYYDVFVWKWKNSQNPEFLYRRDLFGEYPNGLYPTTFFVWKDYFVALPVPDSRMMNVGNKTVLHVRALQDNLNLCAAYEFPAHSDKRLVSMNSNALDTAHLHLVNNSAVTLCRVPKLSVLVFSLPDANLLHLVDLTAVNPDTATELVSPEIMPTGTGHLFFWLESHIGTDPLDDKGRLVQVDLSANLPNKPPVIRMCRDGTLKSLDWHSPEVINDHTFLCISILTGTIFVKVLTFEDRSITISNQRTIEQPDFRKTSLDVMDEINFCDEAVVLYHSARKLIVAFGHYEAGRKVVTYNEQGEIQFTINQDKLVKLTKRPMFTSIDIFRNFICVADIDRIVIFKMDGGEYCSTIDLHKHYGYREDADELQDVTAWKGLCDFAFSEDGIIVGHSHWNHPVAADVILFW